MSAHSAANVTNLDPDRRATPRFYDELEAVYLPGDGTEVPCKFLDFSLMGARISCEGVDGLPDHFRLYVAGIDMSYEAEVKWRGQGQVGVLFGRAERGKLWT